MKKEKTGLTIVGIGASAGGLEALQQFLPDAPTEDSIAYVIVQHLDPKHRSRPASLLDKHAAIPVAEITGRPEPEAGHVYITPPGRDRFWDDDSHSFRNNRIRTSLGVKNTFPTGIPFLHQ